MGKKGKGKGGMEVRDDLGRGMERARDENGMERRRGKGIWEGEWNLGGGSLRHWFQGDRRPLSSSSAADQASCAVSCMSLKTSRSQLLRGLPGFLLYNHGLMWCRRAVQHTCRASCAGGRRSQREPASCHR